MRETDRTLPRIADLDELTGLGGTGLYLRYSKGPDHDTGRVSIDYESDLKLPGLSVTVLDPPDWWTRPPQDWLARQVCKYANLNEENADLRPWVLRGRVVGHGPDHEPLIDEVEPVAWLADEVVRQARRRYEERFDVGRGSTG